MSKRMQRTFALILAGIAVLALTTVFYLAFFFPRLVAAWSMAGQTLTTFERIVSQVSFCCQVYGLILLPVLMGGFLASVLWAVILAHSVSTKR